MSNVDKQDALRLRNLRSEMCRLQYEWECVSRSLMVGGFEDEKLLRKVSSDCVHLIDSVTVVAVTSRISDKLKEKSGWFHIKTK